MMNKIFAAVALLLCLVLVHGLTGPPEPKAALRKRGFVECAKENQVCQCASGSEIAFGDELNMKVFQKYVSGANNYVCSSDGFMAAKVASKSALNNALPSVALGGPEKSAVLPGFAAPAANGTFGAPGAPAANGTFGAPAANGTFGAPAAPAANGIFGAPGANGTFGAPGAPAANGIFGAPGANGTFGAPGAPALSPAAAKAAAKQAEAMHLAADVHKQGKDAAAQAAAEGHSPVAAQAAASAAKLAAAKGAHPDAAQAAGQAAAAAITAGDSPAAAHAAGVAAAKAVTAGATPAAAAVAAVAAASCTMAGRSARHCQQVGIATAATVGAQLAAHPGTPQGPQSVIQALMSAQAAGHDVPKMHLVPGKGLTKNNNVKKVAGLGKVSLPVDTQKDGWKVQIKKADKHQLDKLNEEISKGNVDISSGVVPLGGNKILIPQVSGGFIELGSKIATFTQVAVEAEEMAVSGRISCMCRDPTTLAALKAKDAKKKANKLKEETKREKKLLKAETQKDKAKSELKATKKALEVAKLAKKLAQHDEKVAHKVAHRLEKRVGKMESQLEKAKKIWKHQIKEVKKAKKRAVLAADDSAKVALKAQQAKVDVAHADRQAKRKEETALRLKSDLQSLKASGAAAEIVQGARAAATKAKIAAQDARKNVNTLAKLAHSEKENAKFMAKIATKAKNEISTRKLKRHLAHERVNRLEGKLSLIKEKAKAAAIEVVDAGDKAKREAKNAAEAKKVLMKSKIAFGKAALKKKQNKAALKKLVQAKNALRSAFNCCIQYQCVKEVNPKYPPYQVISPASKEYKKTWCAMNPTLAEKKLSGYCKAKSVLKGILMTMRTPKLQKYVFGYPSCYRSELPDYPEAEENRNIAMVVAKAKFSEIQKSRNDAQRAKAIQEEVKTSQKDDKKRETELRSENKVLSLKKREYQTQLNRAIPHQKEMQDNLAVAEQRVIAKKEKVDQMLHVLDEKIVALRKIQNDEHMPQLYKDYAKTAIQIAKKDLAAAKVGVLKANTKVLVARRAADIASENVIKLQGLVEQSRLNIGAVNMRREHLLQKGELNEKKFEEARHIARNAHRHEMHIVDKAFQAYETAIRLTKRYSQKVIKELALESQPCSGSTNWDCYETKTGAFYPARINPIVCEPECISFDGKKCASEKDDRSCRRQIKKAMKDNRSVAPISCDTIRRAALKDIDLEADGLDHWCTDVRLENDKNSHADTLYEDLAGSCDGDTKWQCIKGYKAPMRFNQKSCKVECWSSNGKDCNWAQTRDECDDSIHQISELNSRNVECPTPQHMDREGFDNYEHHKEAIWCLVAWRKIHSDRERIIDNTEKNYRLIALDEEDKQKTVSAMKAKIKTVRLNIRVVVRQLEKARYKISKYDILKADLETRTKQVEDTMAKRDLKVNKLKADANADKKSIQIKSLEDSADRARMRRDRMKAKMEVVKKNREAWMAKRTELDDHLKNLYQERRISTKEYFAANAIFYEAVDKRFSSVKAYLKLLTESNQNTVRWMNLTRQRYSRIVNPSKDAVFML